MKIIFNLMDVGLNNNGGSHTIIQSANTLTDLGHDVVIVDSGKNLYNWDILKCEHIIVDNVSKFPLADVIIATGLKSVQSTYTCSIPNKFHWIRGHETWVFPEDKIIEIYKQTPNIIKLVNGIGLQKKLLLFGIQSRILRPGYEVDKIFPTSVRQSVRKDKIVLGGLFNSLDNKKRLTKRTLWIFKSYAKLSKEYNISLAMYGSEGAPANSDEIYFVNNPTMVEKNKIYNMADIWLAPTELEGLHIPPAEALLTECPIVGTNTEMNGMWDYLDDNKTGLVSENNMEDFIDKVEILIRRKDLRLKLGTEGRKKILSIGTRRKNMEEFIKFLEDII